MADADPRRAAGAASVARGPSPPPLLVSAAAWREAAAGLATGVRTLVALWGETGAVSMALLDEAQPRVEVIRLDCPDGRYPSVGAAHPPAIRLERAIRDLWGLEAEGLRDERPWLDHGRWGGVAPLARVPGQRREAAPYAFLGAEGEGLHQIPVGPVHAGIIEPGHFRFTANGETVVRLEERLGYVHKGIAGLMRGASLARAARLAGRASGDSTVAYAFAFALAVESATGIVAPPRAGRLRGIMAELERLANHLGDIGAICNDASFSLMQAHCAVLRENVLRFVGEHFGHRLMMDAIVPGGVAVDLDPSAIAALRALAADIGRAFPPLVELYDRTASLQDRTVGTGILKEALARQFGAGGYVGRASGRGFDARKALPYAPYDAVDFTAPVLTEGDVNARVWIRIREVEQSLRLIQALSVLPGGPVLTAVPPGAGRGVGLVEGFRGDVFVAVELAADGRVVSCHLRDPSWFQWPLLEAVIEGNIVADFPLCNKSFNCSYSGHDG